MKQGMVRWAACATLVLAGGAQIAWAEPAALPQVHHSGAVSYLSGGVGSDESSAIKAVTPDYPLALEFYGKRKSGNVYLADVPVTITSNHGTVVLDASSQGPFMLVKLPPGSYTVTAQHDGKKLSRHVSISRTGHARATFFW